MSVPVLARGLLEALGHTACGPGALCARLSQRSDAAHGSTLDQLERTLPRP